MLDKNMTGRKVRERGIKEIAYFYVSTQAFTGIRGAF